MSSNQATVTVWVDDVDGDDARRIEELIEKALRAQGYKAAAEAMVTTGEKADTIG